MALFGRESLPRAMVELIDECYWLAGINATFDADTILAMEQLVGTMNLMDADTLELMNVTGPSWTPNLMRVEGAQILLWQISTGISRANAQAHGVICGTVEGLFASGWIPGDISKLSMLLRILSACNPLARQLNDGSIDLIDEIIGIFCDCFTNDRLPGNASAGNKQEICKLLEGAATECGEWTDSTKACFWAQSKARNYGRSLIVTDTGLIGKIEAGREETRVV
ncbi:hypothetical protein VE03_01623 [Pseudogymnoascus sp. 23342-1-I1]|nr:hypothetical protein VE03_01623 [Pseudogymnoascus sp. 23342-1-I1]